MSAPDFTHLPPGAGATWSDLMRGVMDEGITGNRRKPKVVMASNPVRLYDVWTVDGFRFEVEARSPAKARKKAEALGYEVDEVELGGGAMK